MREAQADLGMVQERCQMLERRNEALTRELQGVKASGWSAVRDAEDKTVTISEMRAQQQELEQRIGFYQQRLSERCATAA
jgi:Tfp pilus assembly protein PilN